ncbi:MAG: hypothetical protein QM813_03545 [Verrucomicrobiota bacterium]
MKAPLVLLIVASSLSPSFSQGSLTLSPVPVTNGLTGTLADASITAGLYYGPTGTTESGLQLVTSAPLVNGFATFGSTPPTPGFPSGTTIMLQVRAWSGIYPSYEAALASGLSSTLAGKSVALSATAGGTSSPPPIPNPLIFPGFTIWPVPEPTALPLSLLSAALLLWRTKTQATPLR